MKKTTRFFLILLGMCGIFSSAYAQPDRLTWPDWVSQLRIEALQEGIRPEIFDTVFSTISGPSARVLKFNNTQPERRISFWEYRRTRANKPRIQMGRQEFQKLHPLLENISKTYGVDPAFILALWGFETDYGRFMGNFPVPQSLATLAFESDRHAFFRQELLKSLHMVQEKQISLEKFKGEWAGASGHPQFLPSSWYKYAVDYDQDGKKDIWTSLPDGLASIANYLSKNGWKLGQPWGIEVTLPSDFDPGLIGKKIVKPVSEWLRLGVKVHQKLPKESLPASIIQLNEGPTLMVFNNFKVLQTWNDSNYYVSTIGYLADQISL